jgi:7-keto-8-aminopelargonate synthetase-like enzyme
LGYFAEPIDPLLGTLFDLPALHSTLDKSDVLVLDEAHSFGVLGEHGRGALEHFNIKPSTQIVRTGTFSKAFGAQGGFILADAQQIDKIKRTSNSFKVSTPLSPVSCAASRESLRLVAKEPQSTIKKLKANIEYANSRLSADGFPQMAANVVPIYHLPDSPAVRNLRERLPGMGMYLPSVTSYFADFCEIGLRWTLQAGHDREQLDKLFDAISEACSSRGKR